jgi:hypothetical protein
MIAITPAELIKSINRYSEIIQSTISDWSFVQNSIFGLKGAFVYFILALSIALFIIRRYVRNGHILYGFIYFLFCTLFLLTCCVEIPYFLSGVNSIWFCMPKEVGWLWTIINFFIFAAVVINQKQCLFDILTDITIKANVCCNWKWGIDSWIGGIIGLVLCLFFFKVGIVQYIVLVFFIFQIIQTIEIFRKFISQGRTGSGFLCFFVYAIGSFATVLALIHFSFLLIIVAIVSFIMQIVSSIRVTTSEKDRD